MAFGGRTLSRQGGRLAGRTLSRQGGLFGREETLRG